MDNSAAAKDDVMALTIFLNGTQKSDDWEDSVQPASPKGGMGEPEQKIVYYLMGIGGLVVCSLGMVANGLSVAVLTRRSMRSSTYTYLAALAVCDSLVLVFTALLLMKDARTGEATDSLHVSYNIYFPYVHPTAIIFQVTSIWLTLAFTVDRYIMICHPFKAEVMCRRSRARKVVVALYVAGIVFCIPKFLEYYTQKHEVAFVNSTESSFVYFVDLTAIGKNEVFREIVHSWMYLLCVTGLPFLTLVILNAFLIHAVRMSKRKGKVLNAKEKHRNDTTIMLIGVIAIFLVCQGPALVSRMIYAFMPVEDITKAETTLNEVANFLVILNSAINIVPYYFFGKKFRSEFWRLFCTCLFDRDELRAMVRSNSMSMDPGRRYSVGSAGKSSGGGYRGGVIGLGAAGVGGSCDYQLNGVVGGYNPSATPPEGGRGYGYGYCNQTETAGAGEGQGGGGEKKGGGWSGGRWGGRSRGLNCTGGQRHSSIELPLIARNGGPCYDNNHHHNHSNGNNLPSLSRHPRQGRGNSPTDLTDLSGCNSEKASQESSFSYEQDGVSATDLNPTSSAQAAPNHQTNGSTTFLGDVTEAENPV